MRISDWSSDVCSSDLRELQMSVDTAALAGAYSKVQGKDYNVSANAALTDNRQVLDYLGTPSVTVVSWSGGTNNAVRVSAQTQRDLPFSRSEEHTSELQSLMRITYADFCLKKNKPNDLT